MPVNSCGCNSVFFGLLIIIFVFLGYDLYKTDAENKEQARKEEEYKKLPKVVPIPDSIKMSWDGSVHSSGWAVPISIYGKYEDMLIRKYDCPIGYEFNNCIKDFHSNPKSYLRKVSTLKSRHYCCSF